MYNDLVYIWSAFVFLSDTRSARESIKLTEIIAWLDENYITNQMRRQEVIYLIHKLDKEFIKYYIDKEKQNP